MGCNGVQEFMAYFTALGYDCYALSLRGQGKGDRVPGSRGNTVVGTAEDIACFILSLKKSPVVVAHSFGGLAMQRFGPHLLEMHCIHMLLSERSLAGGAHAQYSTSCPLSPLPWGNPLPLSFPRALAKFLTCPSPPLGHNV